MTPRQPCEFLVACCDRQGGIYHYALSAEGEVTQKGFYPADRPMYMAIQGSTLYTLLRAPFADTAYSGLQCWQLAADHTLCRPTAPVSTGGEVACHLCVHGQQVYCVNYLSGSVTQIGRPPVVHTGNGPNPARQEAPHTHFVGVTPDDRYLCVTDLGLDRIFLYDFFLHEVRSAAVPAGSGPRHLVFSPDGAVCFVANELNSTVSAFAYQDGRLTLVDHLACLPGSRAAHSTCAAIRYAEGKIYVSNRGDDSLSVLEYNGGRLSLAGVYPVYGKSPRDFILSRDYILVTNESSHSVTVLDAQLRLLHTIRGIPSPLAALFLDDTV